MTVHDEKPSNGIPKVDGDVILPGRRARATARKHAQAAAYDLGRARKAHAQGDSAGVQRHHDALAASLGKLGSAHDSLERLLAAPAEDAHDPIANPTAAQGAQASAGRVPRAFDPESIRLRDQRAGIDLCYRARQEQLQGLRR